MPWRPISLKLCPDRTSCGNRPVASRRAARICAAALLCGSAALAAQVITIDTSGKGKATANGPIDRQFAQVTPTKVDLPKTELDPKTRLMLIREMQSEQGFAMRPFPRGHKGLTCVWITPPSESCRATRSSPARRPSRSS